MEFIEFIHGALALVVSAFAFAYLFFGLLFIKDDGFLNKDIKTGLSTAVVAIFLVWFYFYGHQKLDQTPWTYDYYATEYIECLHDNNMTNGRTTSMRRGYINEDLYYQYMVKLNSGGYVVNKVKAKDATVYYTDEESKVEWYHASRGWLWFTENKNIQKVYIPEGSISDSFGIDLE